MFSLFSCLYTLFTIFSESREELKLTRDIVCVVSSLFGSGSNQRRLKRYTASSALRVDIDLLRTIKGSLSLSSEGYRKPHT